MNSIQILASTPPPKRVSQMLAEVREQAKTILGLEAVSAIERGSAGTLSKLAALTAAVNAKLASAPRATTSTTKQAPRPAAVQPKPAPFASAPTRTANVPDFTNITTRPSDEVLFALAERTFGAELIATLKLQSGQQGLRAHVVAAFRAAGINAPGLRGEMAIGLPDSLEAAVIASLRK